MCGILGIYHRQNDDRVELKPLLRLIRHRGPDDEGTYEDPGGSLQLGFRRLSIIDLETGEQPVSNEDQSVRVVLNGEIYNYVELTAELKKRGHRFRSHGDAEVIAHLYEDVGDGLLEKLEGMFAFALWDERKRRVLIARDHAGIKPLYYADSPSRFVFASEIKPLLRMRHISRELSTRALTQYLTFGYTLVPDTIFAAIRKLPPGHKLVIENGHVLISEFWNLRTPEPLSAPVDEIRARVVAGFDDAIRLHLRSDVPVGAFLSGGLDSGFMVARAARQHSRIRTYTLRFEGGRQDESALAQMVAERYGTDHRTFTVARDSLQNLVSRIVWACDEPLADSGLLPNYVISRLAHEDGMKVVLNGAGGDELFAGYTYFFRSETERRLQRFRVPVGAAASLLEPFHSELARKFRRAALYRENPIEHYVGHVTVWPASAAAELLQDASAIQEPVCQRRQYAEEFAGDLLNQKLHAEIKTYLVDDLMLLLDRMTMAHSLEGRVPFLHRPFMELIMGIPGEVKAPGESRKSLLRSIAAAELPAALLEQPKMGFNSPIAEWMCGPFGEFAVKALNTEQALRRPWWRRAALQAFTHDPRARKQWQHRLFTLFMLEVFCRVHLDGEWDEQDAVPSVEALLS